MNAPKLPEMSESHFERFVLDLPADCVRDCSAPGQDASESVAYWESRIDRPEKCTPEALRAELREYGAWDDEELADDAANWERAIWIAAGDAREEAYEREHYPERFAHEKEAS